MAVFNEASEELRQAAEQYKKTLKAQWDALVQEQSEMQARNQVIVARKEALFALYTALNDEIPAPTPEE